MPQALMPPAPSDSPIIDLRLLTEISLILSLKTFLMARVSARSRTGVELAAAEI